MAYLIPADKGTHFLLGALLTLAVLPLGWKLAAAACVLAAIGREVYGWKQRGRTMTHDNWSESVADVAFTLAGGAVVLAAAAVGL